MTQPAMRKIEVTEPKGFRHGADFYQNGEIRFAPAADAALFISVGWAKDAITGETGVRKPGAAPIVVADFVQTVG